MGRVLANIKLKSTFHLLIKGVFENFSLALGFLFRVFLLFLSFCLFHDKIKGTPFIAEC